MIERGDVTNTSQQSAHFWEILKKKNNTLMISSTMNICLHTSLPASTKLYRADGSYYVK